MKVKAEARENKSRSTKNLSKKSKLREGGGKEASMMTSFWLMATSSSSFLPKITFSSSLFLFPPWWRHSYVMMTHSYVIRACKGVGLIAEKLLVMPGSDELRDKLSTLCKAITEQLNKIGEVRRWRNDDESERSSRRERRTWWRSESSDFPFSLLLLLFLHDDVIALLAFRSDDVIVTFTFSFVVFLLFFIVTKWRHYSIAFQRWWWRHYYSLMVADYFCSLFLSSK